MTKVACFISGPYRYCDSVITQLQRHMLALDYDFEIFIHLWKEDLGNKSRGEALNEKLLRKIDKVSLLIIEDPITIEKAQQDIKRIVPNYDMRSMIGHSTPNAMIGMFCALNSLYQSFIKSENSSQFTHILRLRTDISFNTELLPNELNQTVLVSDNPIINENVVSDHTMLQPLDKFEKIWCFENYEEFINEYSLSDFNPEIFITKRIDKNKIKYSKYWKRYLDYHVVYDPIRKHEPKIIKSLINPEDIFEFNYTKSQRRDLNNFYDYSKDVVSGKVLKYRLIDLARNVVKKIKGFG